MRIVVLTTATTHHAHFVRAIAAAFPDVVVFDEQRHAVSPFPTHHSFEDARDAYERSRWFPSGPVALADLATTRPVASVNDAEAIAALGAIRPDVVVSFGVGKIATSVIAQCPTSFINLHGGDPERYRGLDSHLWTIYHRDWSALVTTLHHVNAEFDDGAVILQGSIPLRRGMPLAELRAANTEVCVALTLAGLDQFARFGRFLSHPQRSNGRYYSFMPDVLKAICVDRFAKHTATRER